MKTKGKKLVIDGLNVYMRHYAANPAMNENGQPVGGIVGFLKGIQLLCEKCLPGSLVVVWEGGGSIRRRGAIKNYKSGRKPQKLNRYYDELPDTVENRNYQLTLLIELMRYLPVQQIYISDCEADDIIGQICINKDSDEQLIIVSSDRDYYQLLSDDVTIWSPGRKIFVSKADVAKFHEISQVNFLTARCFVGDKSDNLPGIQGAGFKTLAKRFPELCSDEFISVNDIIAISQERTADSKLQIYKRISDNPEIPRLNWKMMFLGTKNIAAQQIERLRGQLASPTPKPQKINFLRTLLREEIKSLDVDRLFFSLKCMDT